MPCDICLRSRTGGKQDREDLKAHERRESEPAEVHPQYTAEHGDRMPIGDGPFVLAGQEGVNCKENRE